MDATFYISFLLEILVVLLAISRRSHTLKRKHIFVQCQNTEVSRFATFIFLKTCAGFNVAPDFGFFSKLSGTVAIIRYSKQGRGLSINWGGGVYIHIFVLCPTNVF